MAAQFGRGQACPKNPPFQSEGNVRAKVEQDTKRDVEWVVAEDTGGQANVLLHNDDVTPYDFVVHVMTAVFEFSLMRAVAVTQRAHVTGVAHVGTYSLEDAKHKVGQAHALARAAGYPLTLTVELEP